MKRSARIHAIALAILVIVAFLPRASWAGDREDAATTAAVDKIVHGDIAQANFGEAKKKLRALIVQSGSYATCNGSTCTLPAQLPANHPPTLFLHGADDTIVPPATMQIYHDRLKAMGVEVGLFLAPGVRHAILAESPALVLDWVRRH